MTWQLPWRNILVTQLTWKLPWHFFGEKKGLDNCLEKNVWLHKWLDSCFDNFFEEKNLIDVCLDLGKPSEEKKAD